MNAWIEILKNNDYMGAKKYLKDGADVNEANDGGESVLAMSFRYGCDMELIMLLVDNGADLYDFDEDGVSIFDMAITYDKVEIVKYLIDKGIDVNKTRRRSNFTPLMTAACYGRIEITKLLLEEGADKDAVDSKGITAAEFARKMNKNSVLKLLS